MIIREATLDDITKVVEIGNEFFCLSEYDKVFNFDLDSFTETVTHLITSEDCNLFVIDDGDIQGIAGALLFPFYMNRNVISCQEVFWYVKPKARKGSVGIRLLSAMENWAKLKGANTFNMMSLEKVEPEKVERILLSKGYTKTERHYMRIL